MKSLFTLNLIYCMNQQQNIRGSFSQRLNPTDTIQSAPSFQVPRLVQQKSIPTPFYTLLLIRKNIILTIKNPKNLIFLLLAPFLLTGLLFFFQRLANQVAARSYIYNEQKPTIDFPICNSKDCISLVYMNIVNSSSQPQSEWITHTMSYIKKYAHLNDNQIRKEKDISSIMDWFTYRQYLQGQGANKTQIGILFCINSQDFILSSFCDSSTKNTYLMIINKTDSFSTLFADQSVPIPKDPVSFKLKLLIDNAILDYQLGKNFNQPKIQYTTEQYPVVPNRFFTNFDIITQTGAFYYLITPLFAFLFIQNQIVRQKQYKLRQGLNVFGATHLSYWLSWLFIAVLYALVTAVSTLLAGFTFGFIFFKDTPFLIILILMFTFTFSMQILSFFLSTLAPNLKTANSICYGLVLFAIVVESFSTNENLLMFLFIDNASPLVTFLKYVLFCYPPFSYTKVFTSITAYSGYHFDFQKNYWTRGPGYKWENFTELRKGFTINGSTYTQYSAFYSIIVLLLNIVLYGLLTFYFDNILESNRGRSQSPIFFLKPSYWGFKFSKSNKQKLTLSDIINGQVINTRQEEQSVNIEKGRVLKNISNNVPALGMRIKNLSKTFKSWFSSTRVEALQNITLQIQPNELMSILGHNGAGKTTLINILTGILSPNEDDELQIVINNQNINNISEIRKYIGVCPQFDILWKQLTAQQHLRLFGELKGIPKDMLDKKIDQILQFVSLSSEKKSRVSSFSGGMKRRLSLAVAAIGNPKIIFLDEPTTGLDPKVRQQVWILIQKLKKHKSVVLTTHSMEEADILSDRISILVKGKLKCIESYGSGYRLALNIVQNKSQQVMKCIQTIFPQAINVDSNGGNLLVGISQYRSLIEIIKILQDKQSRSLEEYNLKLLIKDWNVSHTTLEQVFMKVTKNQN